ncbi:PRELI domain containing protein 3A [Lepeophtheirus salmonis]|uniref:PRELI domain containing protein 3A n=1 Tax=Lepeophtheirus salmonis TaxID=72036 RepID=UPI001AE3F90F|nr:PRELI domain containing protein 3A-like [Lepeophtheirus salmonis]
MKIRNTEHVFNHPWETLATSQWRKYPNPHNTSVLRTDVVDRQVSSDGILETQRLICSDWALAPWVQKILGVPNRVCYAHEFSRVDSESRKMELTTVNLSFCNFVNMIEKMSYIPDPDSPSDRTIMKQETIVTVRGVPLTSYMESIILNTAQNNAHKGRKAMEWVVKSASVSSLASKLEAVYDDLKNVDFSEQIVSRAIHSLEELRRDFFKKL